MSNDPKNAPDPDSQEFLDEQNTVERQAPDADADTPATEPNLLPDEPPLVGEDTRPKGDRGDD
jgi:hypothetical protein